MKKLQLTINFVTSNKNKVREFRQILEPEIKVNHIKISYPELRSDNPEEIARNAAETLANTLKKSKRIFGAQKISKKFSSELKKTVVVEDSGLFIRALNDFPGTCSAYIHKRIGLQGILKLMEGIENRECAYKSAVAFCKPNKKPISFLGEENGKVAEKIRGNFGFGHDPIFIPEDRDKTYAEIKNCEELKKFRRMAVNKLKNYLLNHKNQGFLGPENLNRFSRKRKYYK